MPRFEIDRYQSGTNKSGDFTGVYHQRCLVFHDNAEQGNLYTDLKLTCSYTGIVDSCGTRQ